MTNTATAVAEQPVSDGLPNKFGYPEFAGFAGEDLLHDIVEAILPLALYRTWETFERKHAYDNNCFLSLAKVAQKARRTPRTVERNLATLVSRGLMVFYPEVKFFRNPDGSLRKKAVMVKDFSGLYALAHEYYLWMTKDPDYQAPDWEGVELVRRDPCLVAKLRRFEDYRRLLEQQRDPIFLRAQADPRFAYQATNSEENELQHTKNVEVQKSGQNTTKRESKELPKMSSKVSKERINEKAYKDSLSGDSFDLDGEHKMVGEADAPVPGSTKKVREQKAGRATPNESETNPVPSSKKNIPPCAGKTRESAEVHPDVRQARQAMVVAGFAPGRSARRQTETALPPPPGHPLARSFAHEVAGLFGDQNEKGSKTGIERSIETFELERVCVLLCLVRAYVVARDTKDENVRYRRPDTGTPNRMPLFCTMFRKFAQALGPGSAWQYTWEQMLGDIAADDRLSLWMSEHQAELAGEVHDQAETTEASLSVQPEAAGETPAPVVPDEGWIQRDEACACADYLAEELATNEYVGLEIRVRMPEGKTHYQILVLPPLGDGYRLVCEEHVAAIVEMARDRTLFEASDQAEAGD